MAASTAVTWEETPPDEPAVRRRIEIAGLTGLRGFAALMVVLIHTAVLTEYAWVGLPEYGPVSLFVLSGFLLYRPWARWGMRLAPRPSVPDFAWRRVTRIFPAYLVVLAAVSVVYPTDRPDSAGDWLRAATLTWIYVPDDDLRLSLFQTWSLGTELSWYVALPVLAGTTGVLARRLTPRGGVALTTGMICLSLPISATWRWWVHETDREPFLTFSFWLPAFLFCFAAGALVAHLTEAERADLVSLRRLRSFVADRWALPVLALTVALIGTSSIAGPPGFDPVSYAEHQVRVLCATAVAVLLLIGVVLAPSTAPLTRLLSTAWFVAIGRWSYGLYLWHLPVIVILNRDIVFDSGPLGLLWRLVLVLAISVPLGAATYAWVERPTIAWARRRPPRTWRRRTSATTSTSTQPSEARPAAARNDSVPE